MRLPASRAPRSAPRHAFTLIEVVLAIGLAIGLLVVALYLYHQATNLRSQLLQESERLTAIRLVMERLTADLRAAFAQPQVGFTGTASSLRFVKAGAPAPPGRAAAREGWPGSDLRLVTYGANTALEGTNVVITGLTHAEQALIESRTPDGPGPGSAVNASGETATNAPAPMLTEAVRFVQFWFWDGFEWTENWDSTELPLGVEVSLGVDPLPAEASTADYPGEIFRRVIHLPLARPGVEPDLFATRLPRTPRVAHTR